MEREKMKREKMEDGEEEVRARLEGTKKRYYAVASQIASHVRKLTQEPHWQGPCTHRKVPVYLQ